MKRTWNDRVSDNLLLKQMQGFCWKGHTKIGGVIIG